MSKRRNTEQVNPKAAVETSGKEVDAVEKVDKESKAEPVKAEQAENLMYVGPSIAGVIQHSTVFKDGVLPQSVQKCVEECPAMKHLFVPLSKLAEATLQLKKQSALSIVYAQTAQKFTRRK